MKFVAFVILFVVAASNPIVFDTRLNEHWNEFKKAYGKNYNVSEENNRRSIWEKTVTEIIQHNLRYDLGITSYRIGLNEHSDMEHEEFVRTYIGFPKQPRQNRNGHLWIPPKDMRTPDHVDWREKGLVTRVKNQRDCGSCWTFAAAGALEGMHAKKTGILWSLSEQNLLDCAVPQGDDGCKGGKTPDAFDWVINNGGIDLESVYPYTAKQGKCKFNPLLVGARASKFFFLRPDNEEDLKKAVAHFGPIAIYINASLKSFQQYKGGIYDNPECTEGVDHGVLLVGYGTEDGKDYWLVKNSWGTSHGDKGYWKMSRNKNNQCDIAHFGSFPLP